MVITCVAGQRAKDLKCVPEGAPVKVDIGKEGGEQRGEVRSLLEPLEDLWLLSDEGEVLLHHEERADEVAFHIAGIAVRDERELVILVGFAPLGLVMAAPALAGSDEGLDQDGVVLATRRGMMRRGHSAIGVGRSRRSDALVDGREEGARLSRK